MAVDGATGEDEIPAFQPIWLDPILAGKASFIVPDRLVEVVVFANGDRRLGVVEVEDGHVRIGLLDLLRFVGDVLSDQVFVREARLRLSNHAGNMVLPFLGHASEVRLIADLVVEVVEVFQGLHDPADHRVLDGQQILVSEGVDLCPCHVADPVNVVPHVHRAQVPHPVLVEWAEENQFDDDAVPVRLADEVPQPLEVLRIPFRQIELVAAVGITRRISAGPGAD